MCMLLLVPPTMDIPVVVDNNKYGAIQRLVFCTAQSIGRFGK